jgi:hypothetical protein
MVAAMDTLATLVENLRDSPDELYASSFLYFQNLFRQLKGNDASKVQLPMHLPEAVYKDRRALGAVITAAILAMFDHRVKVDPAKNRIAVERARRFDENGVLVYTHEMPSQHREQLDQVIFDQAATIGAGIFASDLATSHFLDWQQHDYAKFTRGLRALDKAARIAHGILRTPITDPFRREGKKAAVAELRPVILRLQKWFKEQRERPPKDKVVEQFRREAENLSLPWLSNPHNLALWIKFVRVSTRLVLTCSPENAFDEFAAFVTRHDSEYLRKKYSQ